MTALPADTFWDSSKTENEAKTGWFDVLLSVFKELPGGGEEIEALTIVSGAIVPTTACCSITIEDQASETTDTLSQIDTSNMEDGRFLLLKSELAADSITFQHESGANGEIHLANSAPFVMSTTDTWLLLVLIGTTWYEVTRTYNAPISEVADDTSPTLGGALDCNDLEVGKALFKDSAETTQQVGTAGNISGTENVDITAGNVGYGTLTGVASINLTNPPATGKTGFFMLELTNGDAYTITWDTAIAWDTNGATAPDLQSSGVDILTFITRDAGTSWRGIHSWKEA